MKKGVTGLIIATLMILALMVQLSIVISYPPYGSGNCNDCHNVAMNTWFEGNSEATVVLDGLPNDDAYHNVAGNNMRVPVAIGAGYSWDREFVNVEVSQNSTHLFIFTDWDDTTINGTDKQNQDPADGIAFIWDIDSDWNIGFENGMKTSSGSIDTWIWKADVSAEGTEPPEDTGTSGTRTAVPVDTSIDTDYIMSKGGWFADTSQDVAVAAAYGNLSAHHEGNYGVEFVRPLVTDDPEDVQFNESRYYDFALAIFNDNDGADHHASFAHKMWIYNPADTHEDHNGDENGDDGGLSFGYMGLFVLALASVTTIAVRRRK